MTTPQQPVLAPALCHLRAPALLGFGVTIHPFCPQIGRAGCVDARIYSGSQANTSWAVSKV